MINIVTTLCAQEGLYSFSSPSLTSKCTIRLYNNISIIID